MNTTRNVLKNTKRALYIIVATLFVQACTNSTDDLTLGSLPVPDFDIVIDANGNSVQFINKTNVPAIAYWTIESTGQELTGDVADAHFIFAGTYDVTLLAASQGGVASITKQVTIAQNDPEACNPDKLLGLLAGCTAKTWRMNPAPGAFAVGPGPGDGSWWSSGTAELTARSCEFDKEYTFHFDAQGTFVYDNKGFFFPEGYMGNQTDVCEPASNLTGAQAAWDSGTFRFMATENAGVNGLGQIRVIGTGAHIGMPKVHNGGETTSGPVGDSITYDVIEVSQNVNGEGYDIIRVGAHIGGDGWWTFTLRSY